ncbi:MAG: hypothetical protein AOA65_0410 [Candidatus Bathyarchaeota archaeon BA1]|nr:MAG: hypothetical protein AOA65_0410 [Candidatus Bathyarchaeota archaeon BA1]
MVDLLLDVHDFITSPGDTGPDNADIAQIWKYTDPPYIYIKRCHPLDGFVHGNRNRLNFIIRHFTKKLHRHVNIGRLDQLEISSGGL